MTTLCAHDEPIHDADQPPAGRLQFTARPGDPTVTVTLDGHSASIDVLDLLDEHRRLGELLDRVLTVGLHRDRRPRRDRALDVEAVERA